ncbi:efflux RND transporter periplasmic adaptor subunit [Fischerella sp. PCC 9605]|uniref:efflux RND transporter periplasmic adaptor subunit n=1 Tax=Fischerella sp. PCC 9605 TaxID=1173024 RepID=UPI0004B025EB|nr:HlyD family efflux transporter periplasmic adaptor subunit [Fischerella sp. PCC 9605]
MKLLPSPKQPTDQKPTKDTEGLRKRLPKFSRKLFVYSAIALATLTLVVWAFRPPPIPVDTGCVTRGELRVTVNAEGKTRVRDRFVVSAPVDGRLARIELDEGDKVEQGTVVARIDPLPLTASVKEALARLAEWQAQREGVATQRPKQATLEQAQKRIQSALAAQRQAEARVAQAQAALAQARRDSQRAQELQAAGVIPRKDREIAELNETTKAKELEAAKLEAKSATAEVQVAQAALTVLQQQQSDPDYLLKVYDARIASVEAELSKLKDEAARTDIRSPVRGQVLRILQKSAQYVTSGTPLLEIGDVSKLELVIDVLSSDAVKIQPGDTILIDRGADTQPILAKVRLVEPSAFTKVSALGVEEQRVNIIGDFVDTPHSFGDAYRVDVQIVIWDSKNLLKIPLSSLFRCDRSWCTFVVKDGKAALRLVEIGQRSDFEAEIRQGLKEGEVVILHPSEQINDGSRVTFR